MGSDIDAFSMYMFCFSLFRELANACAFSETIFGEQLLTDKSSSEQNQLQEAGESLQSVPTIWDQ